jgi:hypothetical protein
VPELAARISSRAGIGRKDVVRGMDGGDECKPSIVSIPDKEPLARDGNSPTGVGVVGAAVAIIGDAIAVVIPTPEGTYARAAAATCSLVHQKKAMRGVRDVELDHTFQLSGRLAGDVVPAPRFEHHHCVVVVYAVGLILAPVLVAHRVAGLVWLSARPDELTLVLFIIEPDPNPFQIPHIVPDPAILRSASDGSEVASEADRLGLGVRPGVSRQ